MLEAMMNDLGRGSWAVCLQLGSLAESCLGSARLLAPFEPLEPLVTRVLSSTCSTSTTVVDIVSIVLSKNNETAVL